MRVLPVMYFCNTWVISCYGGVALTFHICSCQEIILLVGEVSHSENKAKHWFLFSSFLLIAPLLLLFDLCDVEKISKVLKIFLDFKALFYFLVSRIANQDLRNGIQAPGDAFLVWEAEAQAKGQANGAGFWAFGFLSCVRLHEVSFWLGSSDAGAVIVLAEGIVGNESPSGPLHISVRSQAEDIWMSLMNNMSPDRSEVIYMHLGISAIKFRTVYTQTWIQFFSPLTCTAVMFSAWSTWTGIQVWHLFTLLRNKNSGAIS